MIKIVMGGYLDENDKLMSRVELNSAITKMQDQLKEAVLVIKDVDLFSRVGHTDPIAYQDATRDFKKKYSL